MAKNHNDEFLDGLYRQGPPSTGTDAPPDAEQQARQHGLPTSPVPPESLRRVFSVYDSRPILSQEFIEWPASVASSGAGAALRWSISFRVPGGRIGVLRGIYYTLDPILINGGPLGSTTPYSVTLFLDGNPVPNLANMRWPPWSNELPVFVIAPESSTFLLQVDYTNPDSVAEVVARMSASFRGQLLLATGEPVWLMSGHLRANP